LGLFPFLLEKSGRTLREVVDLKPRAASPPGHREVWPAFDQAGRLFFLKEESEMFTRWMFALGISVICLPALAGTDDWPQFRGPNGSAASAGTHLPDKWDTDKNVAWKAKLPGYGWSSPIIWGDKVFVTTAVTDKQRKPSAGFGPGMFGGGPGEGGPGGPGGPGGGRPGRPGGRAQPGQIISPFFQEMLKLTAEQKKQQEQLQKEVDDKLAKIFTDEQKKQLKEMREGGGRGGRGGFGFGGFPQPGQIMSSVLQERLKLTAEQKKQLEEQQKEVDSKLAKILTDEQKKQLKEMREGFARGGFGGFGRQRPPPNDIYKWEVYCLNAADGKVIWKQTAAERKPTIPIHSSNTYATETPVTDGERVYAYFGMTGAFCYDFNGKLVWKKDLGSYKMRFGHGTGSSPVLDGGRLFIQCDNDEKSFLVALDTKTGNELWRAERPESTSWSTPLVWKNKFRTEVVCLGSGRVRSYDPATGKQLWQLGGLNGQAQASMAADDELLYVGTGGGPEFGAFGGEGGPGGGEGGFGGGRGGRGGSGRPLFAVKAGASGDITLKEGATSNEGVAWRLPTAGPAMASPLLYEGLLYILEQRGGFLSCYNAKTGKQVYKERLPGARGFTSSPWAYEGKVFCLANDGQTFVVQAGPAFKLLSKNPLGGEMCWSSPAVAGGALFLRTVDYLYCLRRTDASK
jgi:outer membrane protein assembly factor BamB